MSELRRAAVERDAAAAANRRERDAARRQKVADAQAVLGPVATRADRTAELLAQVVKLEQAEGRPHIDDVFPADVAAELKYLIEHEGEQHPPHPNATRFGTPVMAEAAPAETKAGLKVWGGQKAKRAGAPAVAAQVEDAWALRGYVVGVVEPDHYVSNAVQDHRGVNTPRLVAAFEDFTVGVVDSRAAGNRLVPVTTELPSIPMVDPRLGGYEEVAAGVYGPIVPVKEGVVGAVLQVAEDGPSAAFMLERYLTANGNPTAATVAEFPVAEAAGIGANGHRDDAEALVAAAVAVV